MMKSGGRDLCTEVYDSLEHSVAGYTPPLTTRVGILVVPHDEHLAGKSEGGR